MSRKQYSLIIVILLLVVALRPVKVYCDIPGHTCTSQSITGQYQTTRYQIQPLIITGIEKLIQQDTSIKYRRGSLTEDLRAG